MKYFFVRLISSLFFLSFITVASWAQNSELTTADSLFVTKKYTEAFEVYESILDQGRTSPAMLMKMAYIQEGLGNYADALYYLNLYANRTSDKAAKLKMRELAAEYDLVGYEYSDMKFMLSFLRQYNSYIVSCLLAFSLFLLAYAYRKKQKGERPAISLVLQIFTLALVALLSNNLLMKDQAIINRDNAILMTGPSGGAEPVEVIGKGNKVTLLSSDDLWSQIKWGENEVYIRTKNLRLL